MDFFGFKKPLRPGRARMPGSSTATVVATILISTSSSLGVGLATCLSLSTSGDPNFVYTIAFMSIPPRLFWFDAKKFCLTIDSSTCLGLTRLTEINCIPTSRTFFSNPCNPAWSITGPVNSVSPLSSRVIIMPSNQSAHWSPRWPLILIS